jgi:thiol-disulfide isomerase/thioredoxin
LTGTIGRSAIILGLQLAGVAGGLFELSKNNFFEYLDGVAADKLVVVDFYTDFCGPCKAIKPRLLELADKYADVSVASNDAQFH